MKKRVLSLFLAVCLVLSFTGTAFAEGTLGSFTDAGSARAGILCYYAEKNQTLTGWEELAALKTAGADLTLFSLPATDRVNSNSSATDIANAIICELMKGYRPAELTDLLLSKQNPAGSGRFSTLTNGQIWAMTALNAAGASYPGPAAAQYLLLMQLPDGGFSYNGTAEAGTDADTTGAAAVAIKSFLASDELKTAENQTRIQKMKDYLKNTQQSDGTYASWGTKNASSTASAIWGLSALGENLSDYNKDGHTVTDGLLSFITKEEDGGKTYGYAYDYDWSTATPTAKVSTFSAYYTRQTLIALNDIINGESTYANLSKYIDGYKYRTVTVRAGNLVNLKLTAKSGENCELTAKDAVLQAFAKAAVPVSIAGGKVESVNGEAPAAGTEWRLFVNGRREAFDYKTGDGDSLEVLLESTEYNTVSDLTGAASGTPREITVEAGTQNASVRVQPGTALAEISVSVADGGLSLLIPQNTKVTSSDGLWDGGIVLPRLTGNASIPGATVCKTIAAGVQGKTLTFDRPVRLLIPGGAGKTAAYLDASGNPVRIDTIIGADNVTSAEEKLASTGKTEGRIDVGSDTAVWTKHFTTFVSYSESGGEGSDGGAVTLTVLGFNGQKILDSKSIKLSSGDTPISVLQKSGLSVTVKSGYVKTIDGLSEFEHGANSGWMYGVNGVYPKTGADSFKLKDGDGVCWKYTNDGGTDIGAGTGEETETLIEDKKDCADKLELIKAALVKKSELSAWELYALCASGVKADASKLGAVIKEVGEQQGNIRKPTDIAKYALTVKAAGGDPENAGGYNLIAMLYGNKNLLLQGNNGPIFALITLNSGYYNIPENALWTKQRLKEYIISAQNDDGGYSLVKSGKSDADITAMALQALALYRGQAGAKATIDKALDFLSKNQQDNGGFISDGVNNSESAAQAVIALTALGIDPFSDKRFIKNNSTALSALGTFLRKDNTFSHLSGGESDGMATEQGAMALAAMCRFVSGAAPIFEIEPYYYDDLGSASAWAIDPIVKATKSAIVNGSDGMFRPKSDVTRAEFAAMLSRMLGLDGSGLSTAFSDVKDGSWYKNAVAAAYERKIIEGSNGFFYPDRKITREEMAVMISRAVKLAAGDRTPGDSGAVSSWALAGVKASFSAGIMEGSGNAFRPSERVTREMAATVCQRSAAYAK